MNNNTVGWIILGAVGISLTLFVLISEFSYIADLKGQLARAEEMSKSLQTQVNDKDQEITNKNTQIGNLENQNTGLSTDLGKKEQELTKRLDEVKKLQGSVKTVGRCLMGTVGLIEAFRQENRSLAQDAVQVMEVTCKDSLAIIKEVEGFSTKTGETVNTSVTADQILYIK